jgi:hypothetical protein
VHTLGIGRFRTVSGGDLTRLRARTPSTTAARLSSCRHHDHPANPRLKHAYARQPQPFPTPASTGSRSTTIKLGGVYTSGDTYALTAPSLTTQSGFLLGGHFVGKGGTSAKADHIPISAARP